MNDKYDWHFERVNDIVTNLYCDEVKVSTFQRIRTFEQKEVWVMLDSGEQFWSLANGRRYVMEMCN